MNIKHDRDIIRKLAKEYAQITGNEVNKERHYRAKGINDLIPARPVVWLHEIPWHEMDIDGKLLNRCQDPFMLNMEVFFRRHLFQWEYFPGDMYFEPVYPVYKAYSSTGNGFEVKEKQLFKDEKNHIYSHEYIDQLANEEDVKKFRTPVLTAYPEKDRENMERSREILGDILPVELRGYDMYCAPWDNIPRYRNVTVVLFDLLDRPGYMHRIMSSYMEGETAHYNQMEALGLLEYRNPYLHCTPEFTDSLPQKDYDPSNPPRMKDVWFRTMAQMFADVSPAMHEEFDCQYTKPLADRCGLTYYGCCEALDTKIPMLRRIYKNLRKVGVTPWANEEACAEQFGGELVYARKPNPGYVSLNTDPEVIRDETRKTMEICLKYVCPYELVLKDISTVSYRPENLIIWEKTVRETLDGYYK